MIAGIQKTPSTRTTGCPSAWATSATIYALLLVRYSSSLIHHSWLDNCYVYEFYNASHQEKVFPFFSRYISHEFWRAEAWVRRFQFFEKGPTETGINRSNILLVPIKAWFSQRILERSYHDRNVVQGTAGPLNLRLVLISSNGFATRISPRTCLFSVTIAWRRLTYV